MEGISYSKPEPFRVPEYDYEPVRAIVKATDLSSYYDNLLDDAAQRERDDFTYGIPPVSTKQLHEAAKTFDWKPWAERIRAMGDHYKLKVSGIQDQGDIDVHFIHRKSDNPEAIPLLLVHGWPGSFLEFEKLAQILSEKYHVVMPSIPGYVFSGAPKRGAKSTGGVPWNFTKSAQVFNAVMLSLGYIKYVTQGGDWGSMLTRATAQTFPENVVACHVNFFSSVTAKPDNAGEVTAEEQRGLDRLAGFRRKGSAYQEMQGTVPYTLGAALACSPLALIIYIGEKMYRWSSPETHLSAETVIANSMLYWFTGSITSSFWLYYLRRSGDGEDVKLLDNRKIEQPLAFGCGKYEIFWPVRKVFDEQCPNIRSWRILEKSGGHFLALETPEPLARDIDTLFQSEEVRSKFAGSRTSSKM